MVNPITVYGTSTDIKALNDKEVYIDVDYSGLGLKEPPYHVQAMVTCRLHCAKFLYGNQVFNLTKDGFRVYLLNLFYPDFTPENLLKKDKVELHWYIEANLK